MVKTETLTAFTTGLEEAGIDLVVSIPSTGIKHFIPGIMNDPRFTNVPVANEGDGISICIGAWMGGKKPVLLAESSGLVLGAHSLMHSIRFGGVPMLLVLDYRGDFGDGVADFYFGSATETVQILSSLHIPYTIVREGNKLKAELIRGQRTAEGFGRATAILLNMEELWGLS